MNLPTDISTYVQYSGIATLLCLGLTLLAFILKWGIRFRLVGVTSFMAVVTAAIASLGLGIFTRNIVPGSVHYALVYDNGANQVVISVPVEITESELEATLRQAANNQFSSGRGGIGGDAQFTVRARALLHPEEGTTIPVYLGQAKRPLGVRDNNQLEIEIFKENLANMPKKPSA